MNKSNPRDGASDKPQPNAEVLGSTDDLQAEHEYRLLLDDGEQAYIDSRIRDVEQAVSWNRSMAERMELTPSMGNSWSDLLIGEQLKQWVGGLRFDLPYLGGNFGASDAGIVGGLLLLVASVWCYYSLRRENRVVYFLVKDGLDFHFSDNAKFYLRNQLYSTQLFIEGKHAKPYGIEQLARGDKSLPEKPPFPLHVLIFYLPVAALAFVLIVDVFSLFMNSPMRPGGEDLIDVLCPQGYKGCEVLPFLVGRLVLSLLLLIWVFVITLAAKRYNDATAQLINHANQWKGAVLKQRHPRPPVPKLLPPAAPASVADLPQPIGATTPDTTTAPAR